MEELSNKTRGEGWTNTLTTVKPFNLSQGTATRSAPRAPATAPADKASDGLAKASTGRVSSHRTPARNRPGVARQGVQAAACDRLASGGKREASPRGSRPPAAALGPSHGTVNNNGVGSSGWHLERLKAAKEKALEAASKRAKQELDLDPEAHPPTRGTRGKEGGKKPKRESHPRRATSKDAARIHEQPRVEAAGFELPQDENASGDTIASRLVESHLCGLESAQERQAHLEELAQLRSPDISIPTSGHVRVGVPPRPTDRLATPTRLPLPKTHPRRSPESRPTEHSGEAHNKPSGMEPTQSAGRAPSGTSGRMELLLASFGEGGSMAAQAAFSSPYAAPGMRASAAAVQAEARVRPSGEEALWEIHEKEPAMKSEAEAEAEEAEAEANAEAEASAEAEAEAEAESTPSSPLIIDVAQEVEDISHTAVHPGQARCILQAALYGKIARRAVRFLKRFEPPEPEPLWEEAQEEEEVTTSVKETQGDDEEQHGDAPDGKPGDEAARRDPAPALELDSVEEIENSLCYTPDNGHPSASRPRSQPEEMGTEGVNHEVEALLAAQVASAVEQQASLLIDLAKEKSKRKREQRRHTRHATREVHHEPHHAGSQPPTAPEGGMADAREAVRIAMAARQTAAQPRTPRVPLQQRPPKEGSSVSLYLDTAAQPAQPVVSAEAAVDTRGNRESEHPGHQEHPEENSCQDPPEMQVQAQVDAVLAAAKTKARQKRARRSAAPPQQPDRDPKPDTVAKPRRRRPSDPNPQDTCCGGGVPRTTVLAPAPKPASPPVPGPEAELRARMAVRLAKRRQDAKAPLEAVPARAACSPLQRCLGAALKIRSRSQPSTPRGEGDEAEALGCIDQPPMQASKVTQPAAVTTEPQPVTAPPIQEEEEKEEESVFGTMDPFMEQLAAAFEKAERQARTMQ